MEPPPSCPKGMFDSLTKEKVFEGGVILGKITVILMLIYFAFKNGYVKDVSKAPDYFILESFLIGIGTAIPVIFIGLRRGNGFGSVMSAAFIALLVFFIFNVLMEFSGQNALKAPKELQEEEEALFLPVLISASVIGVVLLAIALMVQKFDMCMSEALLESIVFGFFNAVPAVYIAYNRGEKNIGELILNFLKFFFLFMIGCLILQSGGFWSQVFPLSPEKIAEYAACGGGLKFGKNSQGGLFDGLKARVKTV